MKEPRMIRIEKDANVHKMKLLTVCAISLMLLIGCDDESRAVDDANQATCVTARKYCNAPIEFKYPYLGNVGHCNLQGECTEEDRDGWSFITPDSFTNGVAEVVVRGETNVWTMLDLDRPLYRFGRYECGFLRENRVSGDHAIYMTLFFDGVLVGAEHLRRNYKWQPNTWEEFDDVPSYISQIGGGEWEVGFLVLTKEGLTTNAEDRVDVTQMIIRHEQPVVFSPERRRWLRHAKDSDVKKEWGRVQVLLELIGNLPADTGSDIAEIVGSQYHLQDLFFDLLVQWKLLHAVSNEDKHVVFGAIDELKRIQHKCSVTMEGSSRGSHASFCWGEGLWLDLMNFWLLDGADAECWSVVSEMSGGIDKYRLKFHLGFATAEVTDTKDKLGSGGAPMLLFKIQNDYCQENDFIYAKVDAAAPDYLQASDSEDIPSYVVKVDKKGNIVEWYWGVKSLSENSESVP